MVLPLAIGAGAGGLLAGLGSVFSGLGTSSRARAARRRFRRAAQAAAAERTAFEEQISPLVRFYEQYFQEPIPPWMAQQYVTSLRSAQEARGLAYSPSAARQEAGGLLALAQQGRMAAAPTLLGLYEAPLTYEARALGLRSGQAKLMQSAEAPTGLDILGGVLSSALQGAMGGGMIVGGLMGGGTEGAQGGGAGLDLLGLLSRLIPGGSVLYSGLQTIGRIR